MANDSHKSVSSEGSGEGRQPRSRNVQGEQGAGQDPHGSVTGEGSEGAGGSEPEQVAEDHRGGTNTGELEFVPGFTPDHALNEGMPASVITDAHQELRPAEETAYTSPETVCGSDDRTRVSPATATPWRWICQLIIRFPDGAGFRGTGWLIGPRCVMTAGHCVYSKANGGWASTIEVIPGMDAASKPYGSVVGRTFRSVNGWITSADPNFDYGCIIVPTPIGNTLGYFGFANLNNASLNNLLVNTSGYPGDKPFGTQWFNAGRVSSVTDRKIYYMLDTYGGQSGSPVWRFADNQRHAVGIHAYGGCPNSATRINAAVFANMQTWRTL